MGSCFVRRCIWNNCRTSIRPASSRFLHTADKQPAKPAVKEAPIQEDDQPDPGPFDEPGPPDGSGGDGPRYAPRRKPGITDFDEFLKVQEAWSQKLPLDDDPTIPEYVIQRPVMSHIQSSMRKLFSNDFFIKLQKQYDISLDSIRRHFERRQFLRRIEGQRFKPMRHGILGPDLATGHFVTKRGGRVKFVGHSEWFTDPKQMPNKYDEHFLIEKVDASAIGLQCEGVDNLCNLYYLQDLNLTNNPMIDVWSCDKLARQYRFATKFKRLNVSRCSSFCERSLQTLHRVSCLEEIIITDTPAASYKFLELTILLMQDINPKLKIVI